MFNLRVAVIPRVLVQAKTPQAVRESIAWAKRHAVPLCGHSGGHSYEGFSSVAGLVIDVGDMNGISVDTTKQTVTLGAGCRLGNVAERLFRDGLALPAGTCAPVGIAGLALGGGHGVSSRKFGLTTDNLLSVRLVDASAAELRANSTENTDLFWALQGGGGGNFGVATEFVFRIHPVGRVIVFRIRWPAAKAAVALAKWQNLVPAAADELGCIFAIEAGPNGIAGVRCGGQFLPKNAGEIPEEAQLLNLLRPLTSIGAPTVTTKSLSFIEAVRYFAGDGDKTRVYFKAKSDYAVEPLTGQGIAALLAALNRSAAPVTAIFEAYGGAINRIPASATSFPHRGTTQYCLQYFAQWTSNARSALTVKAIRELYASMRPYFPGFSYVNYTDLDLPNWAEAYYKENLAQLSRVKEKYDPENIFRFAQSIPPPNPRPQG
ncbi:MAG: FAD-binding oxidoreductase [Verrucomicrobia bacterium]|nr:FAD-binding oxidoreductase [Verrucomicrobiota bacterium]